MPRFIFFTLVGSAFKAKGDMSKVRHHFDRAREVNPKIIIAVNSKLVTFDMNSPISRRYYCVQ